MKKNKEIPLNLQFFAQETGAQKDGQTEQQTETATKDAQRESQENAETENSETGENQESLMTELARERVEKKRAERERDEALRKFTEAKNELRKKQTAEEIEDEAKREEKEAHDAEFSRLQEFEKKTLAKDRYLIQGMSADMAEKAALAEVSGDMDALSEIQKQHYEEKLKKERADWQKSIPQPQFGVNEYSSMTKEEIMKIKDPEERVMAIAKNKHLFK